MLPWGVLGSWGRVTLFVTEMSRPAVDQSVTRRRNGGVLWQGLGVRAEGIRMGALGDRKDRVGPAPAVRVRTGA